MQLDNTKIAVRQRDTLEILDVSLHVARTYAAPLLIMLVLGVLPWFLLDMALLGWLTDVDYREQLPLRYYWNFGLLAFIQAPLATSLMTLYLGQAVFTERPPLRQVLRDYRAALGRLAWCHLLVRGVAPATLLMFGLYGQEDFQPGVEAVLLPVLALYSASFHAFRPFINEIVLLERSPLRSQDPADMTVGRRSAHLHSPSGSELFARWCIIVVVALLLLAAVYGTLMGLSGLFANQWQQNRFLSLVALPVAGWLVAGYFTVARFLNYLDIRIRQEGWDVELRLRAEAARITATWT